MGETDGIVRLRLLHIENDEGRVELQIVEAHVLQNEPGFSADRIIIDPERFDRSYRGELFRGLQRAASPRERSQV